MLGYYGTFVLPTVLIILDIMLRFSMIERSGMATFFSLHFSPSADVLFSRPEAAAGFANRTAAAPNEPI